MEIIRNPRLLVGTYTEPNESNSEGVYVYRLDISSGKLTYETVVKDMANVSFMARHPQSGFIYAVNETEKFHGKPGGGVSVLSNDLNILSKQSSDGEHPCYISIERTGRFALVANYTSGTLAMLPIAEDGRLLPASDIVQHVGSSLHPERQASPHPHCIIPDPANRFAIAVDLGIDKLLVYRMDLNAGKLHRETEAQLPAGAGPRHVIFNSRGTYAYLLSELNSRLTVFQYDSSAGTLTELQSIPTLPEEFSGENYCSDLHLSPDEKYLYLSNRGHDSMVCFKVDASSGQLSYQSYIRTNGHYPRTFTLDPSGRFAVVAHQRSNNVIVLKVDPETGDLYHTRQQVGLSKPVHVLFA